MTARLTGHRRRRGTFLAASRRIIAKSVNPDQLSEAGRKVPPACRSPYPINQRETSMNLPQEHSDVR